MGTFETKAGPPRGSQEAREVAAGAVIAGHRIEGELGRGAMGVVYSATHLGLNQPRALKLIRPALASDDRFRRRFQAEARAAASVDHPNVVPVYHAGEDAGQLVLSMKLVDGPSLDELVDRDGALPPERVVAIVDQIANGLDSAHARGLVHRDVKPSNVLLSSDERHVWITDFGICSATEPQGWEGSIDFAAPEQLAVGSSVVASDVYSLGATTAYLLTGVAPFADRPEPARLAAHGSAPRPTPSRQNPDLPIAVDRVIGEAMAVEPGDRYPSAGAFAAELQAAIRPPGRRRRPIVAAALLSVTVLGAIGVLLATDGEPAPPSATPPSPSVEPIAKVSNAYAVGPTPNGIYASSNGVLIASRDDRALWSINGKAEPTSRALPAEPVSVARAFGFDWAVARVGGSVYRVDPGLASEPVRVPVGERPGDIAVGPESVWVSLEADHQVVEIDPESGSVVSRVEVGSGPNAIAYDTQRDEIWTANNLDGTLSRIDAATNDVATVDVGGNPTDIAVDAGLVWSVDALAGEANVSTVQGQFRQRLEVAREPRGLAFGIGSAWVISGHGRLERFDPRTGAPEGPALRVGENLSDIGIARGRIWVSDYESARAVRLNPSS